MALMKFCVKSGVFNQKNSKLVYYGKLSREGRMSHVYCGVRVRSGKKFCAKVFYVVVCKVVVD